MVPEEAVDEDVLNWRGMPEPIPVLTMSWEDVYEQMCETLGRKPSRDEVVKMFPRVARGTEEAMMNWYWGVISDLIDTIDDENKSKSK